MAFKKRFTVGCDHCHTEETILAISESDANDKLNYNRWQCSGGSHTCPSCLKTKSVKQSKTVSFQN